MSAIEKTPFDFDPQLLAYADVDAAKPLSSTQMDVNHLSQIVGKALGGKERVLSSDSILMNDNFGVLENYAKKLNDDMKNVFEVLKTDVGGLTTVTAGWTAEDATLVQVATTVLTLVSNINAIIGFCNGMPAKTAPSSDPVISNVNLGGFDYSEDR